ncbi:hypothetical protein MKW98_019867 [Papaver atlanticum]|uniref:Uncharacterized protein n=1 Tax=Papaver atlanticum TaxID=357466 RepID=A0AAD4X762_9MAGN|nr:hypothetical protein MKW98_019867 [Papaver atlanticum]
MRQWHCPACQNGPGEIDWFNGFQPLMAHAKTKGSKRVKLCREFAELLDEEITWQGTSVVPVGEVRGKCHGLRQSVPDKEIVWLPMVVVVNTLLDQDENEKWSGMGNLELLGLFSALKAQHSYGTKGYRRMSLLIFEGTPTGYVQAERLSTIILLRKEETGMLGIIAETLFYEGGNANCMVS